MAAVREPRARAAAGVRWGVAWREAPGQKVCGDLAVALAFPTGTLFGAVDGLGHGDEAAAAARKALLVLKANADESVPTLFKRCHEALTATRGVVMTLAAYLPGRKGDPCLSWLGVGNVEALLIRAHPGGSPSRQSLMLRNGVVGYMMPRLPTTMIPLLPGDMLVLATDGIRSDFGDLVDPRDPPQHTADRILAQCVKGWDDALVLAVHFPKGAS